MADAYETTPAKKSIVVLGAGVVGITTALELQQSGKYLVTIVSEVIPSDSKTIRYTSQWAGAHHIYEPIHNADQHSLEEETFDVMWKLSERGNEAEECFLRVPQTEYFFVARPQPEPFEKMPNFRHLEPEALIPGAIAGVTFTTVTIDVPVYLNYLLMKFCGLGGRIIRGSLMHINPLLEGGTKLFSGGGDHDPLPEALIVCTGIGSRTLGGVEDKDVYPVRGQTVLIRAPWVRFGRADHGTATYTIPRRSGDVILGGTRAPNDWYPVPRPGVTQDILERALKLCPELAPPDIRATRPPIVDDLLPLVVTEGCGLRPARKGGIRLELEWVDGAKVRRAGRIPVVHNYGHGGHGYQSSWACANRVLALLDGAFSPTGN